MLPNYLPNIDPFETDGLDPVELADQFMRLRVESIVSHITDAPTSLLIKEILISLLEHSVELAEENEYLLKRNLWQRIFNHQL